MVFQQGTQTFAVNTYINDVNVSAFVGYGDQFPYRVSESGSTEPATAEFSVLEADVWNRTLVIPPEAYVRVQRSGVDLFRGFIRSKRPKLSGISVTTALTAVDLSSLLDTTIVVSNSRPAGESDADRIKYFLSAYQGQSGVWLNSDVSKIQTLKASMPAQKFRYLTLRQSIERILGRASESSNYYIDAFGRLHTFDSDHPENDAAPYEITAVEALVPGQAAPEDLSIDFDTASLINDYWVRGKTAAGSGRYSDATSISLFGRRSAYVDGPDSTTTSDAEAIGRAALRDTAYPIARGSFSLTAPYDAYNGKSWKAGQIVTVTSAAHGISAKQYRVLKVGTRFFKGDGARKVDIEFGGLRLRLRGGGTTNVPGAAVQGDIGY